MLLEKIKVKCGHSFKYESRISSYGTQNLWDNVDSYFYEWSWIHSRGNDENTQWQSYYDILLVIQSSMRKLNKWTVDCHFIRNVTMPTKISTLITSSENQLKSSSLSLLPPQHDLIYYVTS